MLLGENVTLVCLALSFMFDQKIEFWLKWLKICFWLKFFIYTHYTSKLFNFKQEKIK